MTTSAAFRRQRKQEPLTWKQWAILWTILAVEAAVIVPLVWFSMQSMQQG